jgi:proline dehydrogenase
MRSLLTKAAESRNFIRIDMEDASVTTATLELYGRLREAHSNVGAVIQARLHRSRADVRALLDGNIANVRLCKGIYAEPEDIAYRDDSDIQQAYMQILEQLFQGNAERVCIATHDPLLVEHAEHTLRRMQIDKSRYEFQMLLGVAEDLRSVLIARGHPLRVYVPFGERWYAYSMRRLRENPRIAMHIVRNVFRRRGR